MPGAVASLGCYEAQRLVGVINSEDWGRGFHGEPPPPHLGDRHMGWQEGLLDSDLAGDISTGVSHPGHVRRGHFNGGFTVRGHSIGLPLAREQLRSHTEMAQV